MNSNIHFFHHHLFFLPISYSMFTAWFGASALCIINHRLKSWTIIQAGMLVLQLLTYPLPLVCLCCASPSPRELTEWGSSGSGATRQTAALMYSSPSWKRQFVILHKKESLRWHKSSSFWNLWSSCHCPQWYTPGTLLSHNETKRAAHSPA